MDRNLCIEMLVKYLFNKGHQMVPEVMILMTMLIHKLNETSFGFIYENERS